MKRKLTKAELRKLMPTLILMLAIGVALSLGLVMIFNRSLGWFSMNREVEGNGASVTVVGKNIDIHLIDSSLTDQGTVLSGANVAFDLDIPNTAAYFLLRIDSTSESNVTVTEIGFEAPNATDEVPRTIDSTDYWFSSQLSVSAKEVTWDANATTAADYFDGTETMTDLATASSRPAFVLAEDVEVASAGSAYIAVKVLFKNLDENQNAYINFGKNETASPAPICTRRFYATFE